MVKNIIIQDIPEEIQKSLKAISKLYDIKAASKIVFLTIANYLRLHNEIIQLRTEIQMEKAYSEELEKKLNIVKEFGKILNHMENSS